MSDRITNSARTRTMLANILRNQGVVNKLQDQVASGVKVKNPRDADSAPVVSQIGLAIGRIDGHKSRIGNTKALLSYQDEILGSAGDLIARAKEIATSAASETSDQVSRSNMAQEIYQIRDQLVSLANSTYQGRYIFAGAKNDTPPYSAAAYTNPASGQAASRYVYTTADGATTATYAKINDNVSIQTNVPGSSVFSNAIGAVEQLARAMDGYSTTMVSGLPNGGGTAFNLPNERSLQTQEILSALGSLNTARDSYLIPSRTTLGARLNRVEAAEQILDATKLSLQDVQAKDKNADIFDTSGKLTAMETQLQASLAAAARFLGESGLLGVL